MFASIFANTVVFAAESAAAESNCVSEAKLLCALGIIDMPDETLNWSETDITNRVFVDYALRLSPYSGEMQYLNLILPTDEIAKTDADYHKYAYIYSQGWLKDETGTGPAKNLKSDFAVKVLGGILGYGKAYENGAQGLANSVKTELLRGVSVSKDGYMSLDGAVRMLANAIDIPYCETEYLSDNKINYRVSKDVTVLVKNKDIYEISGRMNATAITAISGEPTDKNRVKINDTVFDIDDFSYNSLIGRDVTGYAYMKGSDNRIMYLEADGSTQDYVIDGEDFVSYEPSKIKYYDKYGKLKTRSVSNPVIIYNGKKLGAGEYSDRLFEITDGNVTLVKNGGKTDLVIINKYRNLIVGTVDKDNKILTDMFHNELLDFDCDTAVIKTETGKNAEFDTIRKKNIITYLASLDGEYVDAVIGGVYMTEKVDGLRKDGGRVKSISVGAKTYDTAAEFEELVGNLTLGQEYDIFINCNDRVVAVKEPSGVASELGYVMGAQTKSGLSGEVQIKLVTPDSASEDDYIVLSCADKVTADGTSVSGKAVIDALKVFNGSVNVPISYRSNSEGKIYEIDTPNYVPDKESDKSLMQLHSRNGDMVYAKSVINNGYRNHYDGRYYLSFDGICINHATGSDKIVVIDRVRNDSHVYMDIYGFGKDSPLVYFAVVNESSSPDTAQFEDNLVGIKQIVQKNTSDGEAAYFVTLVSNGAEREMQIADEYTSIVNKAGKFDLVRYKINAKNQITAFETVLDYSERSSSIGYENYSWDANSDYRIVTGMIYDVLEDGGCTVSSYKNMVSFYKDQNDIENSREITFMRNAYIYKVERDELTIEAATADDIRTYKDYGDNADMICMTTMYMIPSDIYIIRGEQ